MFRINYLYGDSRYNSSLISLFLNDSKSLKNHNTRALRGVYSHLKVQCDSHYVNIFNVLLRTNVSSPAYNLQF